MILQNKKIKGNSQVEAICKKLGLVYDNRITNHGFEQFLKALDFFDGYIEEEKELLEDDSPDLLSLSLVQDEDNPVIVKIRIFEESFVFHGKDYKNFIASISSAQTVAIRKKGKGAMLSCQYNLSE